MYSFNKGTAVFVVCLLVTLNHTEAWYKQATGPSYYPVGRASGLLSGIRRSPYVRRAETESNDGIGAESLEVDSTINSKSQQSFFPKTLAICIKDVSPNLQSCELVQDGSALFQCKGEFMISLDTRDCDGL